MNRRGLFGKAFGALAGMCGLAVCKAAPAERRQKIIDEQIKPLVIAMLMFGRSTGAVNHLSLDCWESLPDMPPDIPSSLLVPPPESLEAAEMRIRIMEHHMRVMGSAIKRLCDPLGIKVQHGFGYAMPSQPRDCGLDSDTLGIAQSDCKITIDVDYFKRHMGHKYDQRVIDDLRAVIERGEYL